MTPLQTKNKFGKAMGSSCNKNKGIQLIIDAIDSEMLKEKKFVTGILSAHPVRLHN